MATHKSASAKIQVQHISLWFVFYPTQAQRR